jgi:hypothetical protein
LPGQEPIKEAIPWLLPDAWSSHMHMHHVFELELCQGYVSIYHNQEVFKKNKPPKMSMSKFIISATLQYINFQDIPSKSVESSDDSSIIDSLHDEIALLKTELIQYKELKDEPPTIDSIGSLKIKHFIDSRKGKKRTSEKEIRELFPIFSEEDNDNFLIDYHNFQYHYGQDFEFNDEIIKSDYEFNTRYGWKRL